MSTATWAALVLAVLTFLLAAILSVLGIRAHTKGRDSRWTYRRTYWVWVVADVAWALLGLVDGLVDRRWFEAAPILVGAVVMAVITGRRPKTRDLAPQR